jgi:4-amino-4-deoxy-L-arabinose transferase-like glycosyltransferase
MYRVLHDKYLVSALLPMLFSLIAIISTFFVGRQLFDRRVGFFAALFLALSPLFSFQGYFVATDVPSVAVAMLTLSLFLAALRRDSLPLAAVSGCCLLLTVAVKLTGLYCALLIVLAWLLLSRRSIRILATTLAFLLFFPVLYWGPLLLTKGFDSATLAGAAGNLWTWMKLAMFVSGKERPADWNYLLFQSGQVHHYMGPSSTFFYLQYLANAVGFPIFFWAIIVLILFIEAWWRGLRDQWRCLLGEGRKLVLLAVWVLVLLAFLSPWLMRNTRFSYLAFPAYAVLAGYGFVLFKKHVLPAGSGHSALLLSLTVVTLVTLSLAHYYSFTILVNHKYRDPLFVETTDAYYCVHRHYGGWHVCWSGGAESHTFVGELVTDGRFVEITPFDLERADSFEISESQDRISFQGSARVGRDGFDFQIEDGNWISLDLLIDGVRYPERVHLYTGTIAVRQDEAATLPLKLVCD